MAKPPEPTHHTHELQREREHEHEREHERAHHAQTQDAETKVVPPPSGVILIESGTFEVPLGVPLSLKLTATGGTDPYKFSVDFTAPSPPADVTLSEDGLVHVGALIPEAGWIFVVATDLTGLASKPTPISILVA